MEVPLECNYAYHSIDGLKNRAVSQTGGEFWCRGARGTDCGLGGRVHPQIAWAKLRALRDGAAIASKKLWS